MQFAASRPGSTEDDGIEVSGERYLGLVTLVVRDYDEAIGYFTERLGFILVADRPIERGKRWVVVSPEKHGTALLLAKAADAQQAARVGDQTGGRVSFFLYTDNFQRDHQRMQRAGVEFIEAPRQESYGIVAKFRDLYGNRWDLLQPDGDGI
jgi:catechol 2,3-dioxygenase-like lactoylglutathione lyase family enzyme